MYRPIFQYLAIATLLVSGVTFLIKKLCAEDLPVIPKDTQIALLRLDKDWLVQAARMNVYATAYQKASDARDGDESKISDVEDKAIKAAHLDPAKWDIDTDEMIFIPREQPVGKDKPTSLDHTETFSGSTTERP